LYRKLCVQPFRQGDSKRGPRSSRESNYSSLKIAPEQRIANRPEDVNSQEIAGHWEGDLIIGTRNQSCVGTLVARKTGFLILAQIKDNSAQRLREGFEACMEHVPHFLRPSMTYDRGVEMSEHPVYAQRPRLAQGVGREVEDIRNAQSQDDGYKHRRVFELAHHISIALDGLTDTQSGVSATPELHRRPRPGRRVSRPGYGKEEAGRGTGTRSGPG
jgi:hypothetical protein